MSMLFYERHCFVRLNLPRQYFWFEINYYVNRNEVSIERNQFICSGLRFS